MTFTKEQVKNMANVNHIFQLKRIAENNGSYFFSDGAMRSFQSRIHDVVYGGCVSVDKRKRCVHHVGHQTHKDYTLCVIWTTKGNTHTISEFQEFGTRSKAHTFAYNMGIKIGASAPYHILTRTILAGYFSPFKKKT